MEKKIVIVFDGINVLGINYKYQSESVRKFSVDVFEMIHSIH